MLPLFISCTNTEVCVPSSLALDNWGQKYRHTLGNKPNPSIPIIFDRFTFKFLKNRPVTRQDKKYRKLKIDKFIFSLQNNRHAVCCEDNWFAKGKFKWFKLIVCFTQCTLFSEYVWFLLPICLPCVICRTYVMTIHAVSWHRAADILVASLGLFTFARIACLLQIGIKPSDIDYYIWATPK